MLVIDKDNDSVLLSRQSRFVPRMWSCLAGFIEVCFSFHILLHPPRFCSSLPPLLQTWIVPPPLVTFS